jgi:hypothetical protein
VTVSSKPKRNVHGRVGKRRRRPTTNQALRAQVSELETRLNATVPRDDLARATFVLNYIRGMTDKSKTGVAHKVNQYVSEFLDNP